MSGRDSLSSILRAGASIAGIEVPFFHETHAKFGLRSYFLNARFTAAARAVMSTVVHALKT
jgi:hypothetical protein